MKNEDGEIEEIQSLLADARLKKVSFSDVYDEVFDIPKGFVA